MVENKDLQMEYNLFADVWKFFKSKYDMPNNEAKWKEVIEASHQIEEKYNNQLCNDLLTSVVMELERKHVKSELYVVTPI